MESSEELQQNELTALKSIYAEDFIETPPPKAWKGAARLPEFIIRVSHLNPDFAKKICFNLHVMCVSIGWFYPLTDQLQISQDLSRKDKCHIRNTKTYQWTLQRTSDETFECNSCRSADA